jgi:hypothetical protein
MYTNDVELDDLNKIDLLEKISFKISNLVFRF